MYRHQYSEVRQGLTALHEMFRLFLVGSAYTRHPRLLYLQSHAFWAPVVLEDVDHNCFFLIIGTNWLSRFSRLGRHVLVLASVIVDLGFGLGFGLQVFWLWLRFHILRLLDNVQALNFSFLNGSG